jgi:ABC-type transporter Mla subunit MlaD
MRARRGLLQTLAASSTMIGAVTTLIVVVAVFLSYNANQGLPFVPVYRVSLDVHDAARLTPGNEVRIGGHRVGVVESIETIRGDGGGVAARVNLKLDRTASPLPQDSIFRVRYQSTFGLKYVEVVRGTGPDAPEGFAFDGADDDGVCKLPVNLERFSASVPTSARNGCFQPQQEFDVLANVLDRGAREDLRATLVGLGDAFAGRGGSVGDAIEAARPFLDDARPVLRTLANPRTRLERFLVAAARAAGAIAPVADSAAALFTNAAATFEALSRDPEALADSVSGAVPLLERAPEVRRARLLLADVAALARRLEPGAARLPLTLPVLNEAIEVGGPVLDRVPAASGDLRAALVELRRTIDQPATGLTLERLDETFRATLPAAAYLAPAQTVCNYPTYLFTFLSEHLSLRSTIGYTQRNTIVFPHPPDIGPVSIGGVRVDFPGATRSPISGYAGIPADGLDAFGYFRPRQLPIGHGPINAPSGQAGREYPDCAAGQFGYPLGWLPLPGQPPEAPGIAYGDYPDVSLGPTDVYFNQDGSRELRDSRVASRAPTSWETSP